MKVKLELRLMSEDILRGKIVGAKLGDTFTDASFEDCMERLKDPERDYELVNGVEALEDLNTLLRGRM